MGNHISDGFLLSFFCPFCLCPTDSLSLVPFELIPASSSSICFVRSLARSLDQITRYGLLLPSLSSRERCDALFLSQNTLEGKPVLGGTSKAEESNLKQLHVYMAHLLLWTVNSNADPRERRERKRNGKWGSFSVPVDNAPRDGEGERGAQFYRDWIKGEPLSDGVQTCLLGVVCCTTSLLHKIFSGKEENG